MGKLQQRRKLARLALPVTFAIIVVAIFAAYSVNLRAIVLSQADATTRLVLQDLAHGTMDLQVRFQARADAIQRYYLLSTLDSAASGGHQSLRERLSDLVYGSVDIVQILLVDLGGKVIASSDALPGDGDRLYSPDSRSIDPEWRAIELTKGASGIAKGRILVRFGFPLLDRKRGIVGSINVFTSPELVERLSRNHMMSVGIDVGIFSPSRQSLLINAGANSQFRADLPPEMTSNSVITLGGHEDGGTSDWAYAYVSGFSGSEILLTARFDRGRIMHEQWLPHVVTAGLGAAMLLLAIAFIAFLVIRADQRELTLRQMADASHMWFEAVFRSTPDSIVAVNAGQIIIACNPATRRILGWEPHELIGKPISMLVPNAKHTGHSELARDFFVRKPQMQTMGDYRQVRAVRADGTHIPVMVSLGYFETEGLSAAIAVLRDMSTVEEANTRLSQLTTELSHQLEIANSANCSKARFLASMSHELRTPLNAIIGFSQLMEQEALGPLGNDRYKEYAHDVRRSGEHLLSIINDILDISRIDAGKTTINLEVLDCGAVWDLPLTNARVLADKSEIKLSRSATVISLEFLADKRALQQCLFNLLSNAIKFTPKGGRVTCRSEVDSGLVAFVVEDNGIGIAPGDLKRLGQPFEQLGNVYNAETKGTGLGLTITKRLAELMGGRLELVSELGVGTRASIYLPLRVAHAFDQQDVEPLH